MNFYDSLNEGDASLREPHFTSLLFYLFKVTKDEFPENSFLDLFISKYLSFLPKSIECNQFDSEDDIKIEQILRNNNIRRDTDIIIFLRHEGELKIINIENKISNQAFQKDQITDQQKLLRNLYPKSEIFNVLILPYYSESTLGLEVNTRSIYWYAEENSLIDSIIEYVGEVISNNNLQNDRLYFLQSYSGLFKRYYEVLEQEVLSNENMTRGPRNQYRHSMYIYLDKIAKEWENIFKEKIRDVRVSDLLKKFEELVSKDLEKDFPNDFNEKIAKFRRGALEAQPKIMTINEKNRVHFGICNPNVKKLFYYPDAPSGNFEGRWKDVRIKPLRLMNEEFQYIIYWKNCDKKEIQSEIYKH